MENSLVKEFMGEIEGMRFIGIDDLFLIKQDIRKKYRELEKEYKEMYKWYFFFQLSLLKNPLKSTMWNYINGENNFVDLDIAYNSFCTRRENIAKLTKNTNI